MTRRARLRLIVALVVGMACVILYDRLYAIHYYAPTDLYIEWRTVPGARVEVKGVDRDDVLRDSSVTADAHGIARLHAGYSPGGGERSGLGWTDTFGMVMPHWRYRIVVPGGEPTEWIDLHTPENACQAQRMGNGRSLLVVETER